ncbi:MAG: ASCH domain-containing protein [Saprospiraceae bacterium]|nr:ASCH domain-containing protein [Saprospiraceae bacterium]
MLFKEVHLHGIKSGAITLAFRKWQKPSIKVGIRMHTSIGLIEIKSIEVIAESDINKADAINAGFASKEQLLKSFPKNSNGVIYRINISYYSEDPRISLREHTNLSEQEINDIIKKLKSLDKHSKKGDWTRQILLTINDHPNMHAIGIAKLTGFEKEWLKLNIRKLKNLGLTISHTVGYEISPKGKVVLEKLIAEK